MSKVLKAVKEDRWGMSPNCDEVILKSHDGS